MPLPSLGRMWIMSKRYPPEQRARAVKMVLDHLAEYRSVYAACQAIGPKVGVGVESLRQWTVQAQIDAQQVPGPTTAERQRIKDLGNWSRHREVITCLWAAKVGPRRA